MIFSQDGLLDRLDDLGEPDEKVSEAAKEIETGFNDIMQQMTDDEDSEYNPANILQEDDYLVEELVDKLSYLNILETQTEFITENDTEEFEDLEEAYLSVIDSFFELAKIVNPLSGFGRVRLESGISTLRSFEERFGPLTTKIVPENAAAFESFISDEHLADLLAGRKRGIGALRHIDGRLCAVGAVIYTVYEKNDTDEAMIELNWIMVHEDMRESGTGNLLMAQLLELALMKEDTCLITKLPVVTYKEGTDESEIEERTILENFLDQWGFEFTIDTCSDFVYRISDYSIENYDDNYDDTVSLAELETEGKALLDEFLGSFTEDEYSDLLALPIDYYDSEVSCAVMKDGKIHAVFLVKRFDNDNYRCEALRCKKDSDTACISRLLAHAYNTCIENGDRDSMIYGSFQSEETLGFMKQLGSMEHTEDNKFNMEGLEIAKSFIDTGRALYAYRGSLHPLDPDEEISVEEWDMLKESAGINNNKIPASGIDDIEMVKEVMKDGFVR